MVRPPSFDSNGMKKGAWSEEEDNKLRAYVLRYGHWNWRLLPKYAGLARCGKSCRLRWVNYLKPGVKRGNFSKEEEDLIIKLHAQLGNKWSAIAAKLPGRTDNEIKNFWHTRVERRDKRNPAAKKVGGHTSEASCKDQVLEEERASQVTLWKATRNESESLEEATSLDKFDANTSLAPIAQSQVDVWPDKFLAEEEFFFYPQLQYSELSSSDSSYLSPLDWIADDDHCIISSECVAAPSVQGSFWSESSASNSSNSQSSYAPVQDVGGLYDPLLHDYFDYGVDLFI